MNETNNTVSYLIEDGKNTDTMYVFKKSPKPYRLTSNCDEGLYKILAQAIEENALEGVYCGNMVRTND